MSLEIVAVVNRPRRMCTSRKNTTAARTDRSGRLSALALCFLSGLLLNTSAMGGDRQEGPDVVMFSSDYCPPCLHAKQYLRENNIPARIFDIDESPAARTYFEKLGGRGLPLIFVDNRRLDGYTPERFQKLYGPVPGPIAD